MRTSYIRDSYKAEVWLTPSIVSWLDAKFPDGGELEMQIVLALQSLKQQDERRSQPQPTSVLQSSQLRPHEEYLQQRAAAATGDRRS